MYVDDGMTTRQIAAKTGIPARTVTRYLDRCGISLRTPGPPTPEPLKDREWLVREYIEKRRSTPDIAAQLGCAPGSVRRWLIQHKIETQNSGSEKGHLRNASEEVRTRQSLGRRGKLTGADNPNWQGGNPFVDPERRRYKAKAWTKAVKDRDGWRCAECGSQEGELHAHHIKRWRDYPELRYDVANGITLCVTCHEKAHGKGFKFRWRMHA